MTAKQESTFCVLPWIHSFVNIGGEYQVCCTGEEHDNYILSDVGHRLNIVDTIPVDNIMNTEFMKQFRQQMLNAKWPMFCKRCQITERDGGTSRRLLENFNYATIIPELINNTGSDGSILFSTICADYRLGNICNLSCRMCSPRASNQWNNLASKLIYQNNLFQANYRLSTRNNSWTSSQSLLDDFRQKVTTLSYLHFAGGEPLISANMKLMLKICVTENVAKKITLTYNTNITCIDTEILNLWKSFKEVKLLCSVDAYGELNDYIREGSSWKKIDSNLKFLEKNAKLYNISEILISTTVQAYNILYLDNIFFYLSNFKNIIHIPNLINLHHPNYLSTQVLPPRLKDLATKKCLELKQKYASNVNSQYRYLLDNITQVINYMNAENHSQELLDIFFEFNNYVDRITKKNLLKTIPEFRKYYVNTK